MLVTNQLILLIFFYFKYIHCLSESRHINHHFPNVDIQHLAQGSLAEVPRHLYVIVFATWSKIKPSSYFFFRHGNSTTFSISDDVNHNFLTSILGWYFKRGYQNIQSKCTFLSYWRWITNNFHVLLLQLDHQSPTLFLFLSTSKKIS